MKRASFPLEGASDRALKYRRTGLLRIQLEKLGFRPENRYWLGLSPPHVHDVAWDCLDKTTQVSRYKHVDVVELSAERMPEVLEVNKQKC